MTAVVSFRARHSDFQHLAREVVLLDSRNADVAAGRISAPLHLFSQLTLTFLALERFLRMLLGEQAPPRATLRNLLEQATGRKAPLLRLDNREQTVDTVNTLRVGLMHGILGTGTEAEHMLSRLFSLSRDMYALLDGIVAAVDPETGLPRPGASPVRFAPKAAARARALEVLTPDGDVTALHAHNWRHSPSDAQDDLLLLAEGALCLVLVEAAARRAVGNVRVTGGDGGFEGVLRRALHGEPTRLSLSSGREEDVIEHLSRIRNCLLHGNFEQAAQRAGCVDAPEYFKTHLAPEIEFAFLIYQWLRRPLVGRGAFQMVESV